MAAIHEQESLLHQRRKKTSLRDIGSRKTRVEVPNFSKFCTTSREMILTAEPVSQSYNQYGISGFGPQKQHFLVSTTATGHLARSFCKTGISVKDSEWLPLESKEISIDIISGIFFSPREASNISLAAMPSFGVSMIHSVNILSSSSKIVREK